MLYLSFSNLPFNFLQLLANAFEERLIVIFLLPQVSELLLNSSIFIVMMVYVSFQFFSDPV